MYLPIFLFLSELALLNVNISAATEELDNFTNIAFF